MQQINRPRTVRRAGYRGTRNHHQATGTRRLETTLVRRPRVGQRAIPLSTPARVPIHVPYVSPWNYKRGGPGADTKNARQHHRTHKPYTVERFHSYSIHTTLVFTPVQALRCKIIQTLPPPLDVGPSLARTRINLCVFLHHHLKGSTHTNLLVGVIPGGKHRHQAYGMFHANCAPILHQN